MENKTHKKRWRADIHHHFTATYDYAKDGGPLPVQGG